MNMFLKRGDDVKKLVPFLLSFLIVIGAFPAITSACKCAGVPSAENELKRSKVVFSGKVIEIKDKKVNGYILKSVRFEVMNTWKGIEESQIIITTGQGGGDCGFAFHTGEEYLVYASESDMYGEKSLITGICDRTGDLGSLREDLKDLGAGTPPTQEVDLSETQTGSTSSIWAAIVLAIAIGGLVLFLIKKNKKSE